MQWLPLTWEAVATFATGIMAVIAAGWVGYRQTSISERQVEIQHRQTEIAQQALRLEAFDRRYKSYAEISKVFGRAVSPDINNKIELGEDFLGVAEQTRFIFSEDIHEHVAIMIMTLNGLNFARNRLIEGTGIKIDQDDWLINRKLLGEKLHQLREMVRPYLSID